MPGKYILNGIAPISGGVLKDNMGANIPSATTHPTLAWEWNQEIKKDVKSLRILMLYHTEGIGTNLDPL